MNELKPQPFEVQMEIVVRDKFGNVKYQGPLNMNIVKTEERKEDGDYPFDSGEKRSR